MPFVIPAGSDQSFVCSFSIALPPHTLFSRESRRVQGLACTLHPGKAGERDPSGPASAAPTLTCFSRAQVPNMHGEWSLGEPDLTALNGSASQYASNGVTGGCQQIYTVYQRPNTTLNDPPTCQNLTYPSGALDVKATGSDGSWSAYGWYDQVGPQNA